MHQQYCSIFRRKNTAVGGIYRSHVGRESSKCRLCQLYCIRHERELCISRKLSGAFRQRTHQLHSSFPVSNQSYTHVIFTQVKQEQKRKNRSMQCLFSCTACFGLDFTQHTLPAQLIYVSESYRSLCLTCDYLSVRGRWKLRTWKWRTMKMTDMKMQDMLQVSE